MWGNSCKWWATWKLPESEKGFVAAVHAKSGSRKVNGDHFWQICTYWQTAPLESYHFPSDYMFKSDSIQTYDNPIILLVICCKQDAKSANGKSICDDTMMRATGVATLVMILNGVPWMLIALPEYMNDYLALTEYMNDYLSSILSFTSYWYPAFQLHQYKDFSNIL